MSTQLHDSGLSGTVPLNLGKLTSIESLWISSNKLNGTLPENLGGLTRLVNLTLSGNQFGGTIPTYFGGMTNLTRLWLANNAFTGGIPDTLANLAALKELSLDNNQLNGTISPLLGKLTDLTNFTLSNNRLTGSIPGAFSNLTSLAQFNLGGNQLDGQIPDLLSRDICTILPQRGLQPLCFGGTNRTGTCYEDVKSIMACPTLAIPDPENSSSSPVLPIVLGVAAAITVLAFLFFGTRRFRASSTAAPVNPTVAEKPDTSPSSPPAQSIPKSVAAGPSATAATTVVMNANAGGVPLQSPVHNWHPAAIADHVSPLPPASETEVVVAAAAEPAPPALLVEFYQKKPDIIPAVPVHDDSDDTLYLPASKKKVTPELDDTLYLPTSVIEPSSPYYRQAN
ncbi:hypothetical protein BC828DRAFT_375683 [Blastocladiella britannica]|nr:hypothetical protein BC828DRAFT_375683 [Blastocladiella britannica]